MFSFRDYFDETYEDEPYVPGEECDDYLALLEMLLESLLAQKGLFGEEGRIFPKGLTTSERDISNYFSAPPALREPEEKRVSLADFSRALRHIRSRAKKDMGNAPITEVFQMFELDDYQMLAVILALSGTCSRRFESLFSYLHNKLDGREPTFGLLDAVFETIGLPETSLRSELSDPSGIMQRFFLLDEEKAFLYSFRKKLLLHPYMQKYLTGEEKGYQFYEGFVAKEYRETPVFSDAMEPDRKKLFQISELAYAKELYYFVETSDLELVEALECKTARDKNQPLYILDLRTNPPDEKSGRKFERSVQELMIRRKLFPGRLLIRLPELEREAKYAWILLKKLHFLEPGDSSAGLYGFEKMPEWFISQGMPSLQLEKPEVEERVSIWKAFMEKEPLAEDVSLEDIADCYEITYGEIKRAAEYAVLMSKLSVSEDDFEQDMAEEPKRMITREQLIQAVLRQNTARFGTLASEIKPVYVWEDITMQDGQREVLMTACRRYKLRNRIGNQWGLKKKNAYGNGVSILLYGPPGTGKTMAAQVVAREVGLPLYRVDLSQLFSKYIGETEKNLAMIFEEASHSNVILFFDEADALFSKRTEVGDSNDKYANAETAYLLQKIEEYRGISILATNFYNNFDQAFVRRITYAVHLESPNEEERLALWLNILPPETPREKNIDFKFFADQFELSGSNIKAILYSASFMAGAEGVSLGPKHIVKAMKYEFEKLGRMIDGSQFGKYAVFLYR